MLRAGELMSLLSQWLLAKKPAEQNLGGLDKFVDGAGVTFQFKFQQFSIRNFFDEITVSKNAHDIV